VVQTSRWRALLLVIGAVLFVAVSVWLVASRASPVAVLVGVAGIVTFSAFGALGLLAVVRPGRVLLAQDRLEYRMPYGSSAVLWEAILGAELVGPPSRGYLTVIAEEGASWHTGLNRSLAGVHRRSFGSDVAIPENLIRADAETLTGLVSGLAASPERRAALAGPDPLALLDG